MTAVPIPKTERPPTLLGLAAALALIAGLSDKPLLYPWLSGLFSSDNADFVLAAILLVGAYATGRLMWRYCRECDWYTNLVGSALALAMLVIGVLHLIHRPF